MPNPVVQTQNNSANAPHSSGIVIIGAGMAGSRFAIRLARAQRQAAHTNSDALALPITLISKESQVGYNRIMLSPVLAGETPFEDTYLYDQADYEQLGIEVIAGVSVDTIDTKRRMITLSNDHLLCYQKLVIATGSTARVIPLPNYQAKGVHVFRDSTDVTALSQYARAGKTGIVIGGGVLGLEAACALAAQGAHMSVVHTSAYVLNHQLDLPAATLLQAELARRGVGLEVLARTESIEVDDKGAVCGLSLQGGRTLDADFIVMAVGIIPNIQLAKDCGLDVDRGIIVDDCMHTSCPDVYAIGECIEHNGELFGMVSPVNQQVDTLVSVLKGSTVSDDSSVLKGSASGNASDNASNHAKKKHWQPFISKPLSLKLKVSGMAAFSAGRIAFTDSERESIETLIYRQTQLNHYQCLYLEDNKLIGAVLYGEIGDAQFYDQLIANKLDISSIKETLLFGEAYCSLDDLAANDVNMIADAYSADTYSKDVL